MVNKEQSDNIKIRFDHFAILPAIATMFDDNEDFDAGAQKKLVRFLLGKGIDGLYIGGSTGEGFLMKPEERKKVISETIEAAEGRVVTIAYVGSIDTKTAIELAKHAEKEGADAISSVPPYYYGFHWEEIENYYQKLSESVGIPLIAYNNSNSGLMGLDHIREILKLRNCGGIKYTSPDHFEMKQIQLMSGSKPVFSGADEMFASALVSGVDGAIGATYNFAPEIFIEMRKAFQNNDNAMFMKLSEASVKLVAACFRFSYTASMKTALELLGIGKRIVKSPRFTLSEDSLGALQSALRDINREYDLNFVELLKIIE